MTEKYECVQCGEESDSWLCRDCFSVSETPAWIRKRIKEETAEAIIEDLEDEIENIRLKRTGQQEMSIIARKLREEYL